jgi:FtsZ-binding cell division protein ZapB
LYHFNDYNDINWFLSLPFYYIQKDLCNKSIQFISRNFETITITILQKLFYQFLEIILLNHESIKLNQSLLFQVLTQEENKQFLLKYVNLCEVDFKLLKPFLEHLEGNEHILYLFETIKELLLYQLKLIQNFKGVMTLLQAENSSLKEQNNQIQKENEELIKDIKKLQEENQFNSNQISYLQSQISQSSKDISNSQIQENQVPSDVQVIIQKGDQAKTGVIFTFSDKEKEQVSNWKSINIFVKTLEQAFCLNNYQY